MNIKFLSAGCGDAISIRFDGDDGQVHNILLDGGTAIGDIYPATLRLELLKILERNEKIDLWVITHIDDDHIGGILRLIKDSELLNQLDLSQTRFLYNQAPWDYDTGLKTTNLKSVRQGMLLRDFLETNSVVADHIVSGQNINLYGAEFTILSPGEDKLSTLMRKWQKEEIKIRRKGYSSLKMAKANDYGKKLEEFKGSIFSEDTSEENGSSIAFILSYKGKQTLFLADSHPTEIVLSLTKLGYSPETPLRLEFVKLSHHGSKLNTNDELLALIDCEDFIISADGYSKNLPDKETLARILQSKSGRQLTFHITHKNALTSSIFKVDDPAPDATLLFPVEASNGLEFKL